MKKIFKVFLLISVLLTILGCGNDKSPKPLETKFIGTYIDDSWDNIKRVVNLDSSGKNLFISYEHIDSKTIKGKSITDDKITLEIENALFIFDKENNKYILNEETIKNVKATRTRITNMYKNTSITQSFSTYKEFKDKTNAEGIAVEIKVNDTRKEVLLDVYVTGAYGQFINFIEGYKQ